MNDPSRPLEIPAVIEVRPADIPTVIEVYPRDLPAVVEVQKAPRGHPLLAWLVIILMVGVEVALANFRPVTKDSEITDRAHLVVMQLQGRYFLGAYDLMRNLSPESSRDLYQYAQALNVGSLGQRLRFVTLAGELKGAEEALRQLDTLDDLLSQTATKPSAEQIKAKGVLAKLYGDYQRDSPGAPSLSEADRSLLRDELGWFGRLALAPANGPNPEERAEVFGEARRTAIALWTVFGMAGFLGLIGLIGLILLGAFFVSGRVRCSLARPSSFGGIYAETFAVYFGLFLVLSLAGGLIEVPSKWRLLLAGGAAIFSLTALAWPVWRGVPWHQVKQEIGLTAGRRPWLEPFLGITTYAMALPLLVVGVLIMVGLMAVVSLLPGGAGPSDPLAPSSGAPVHPIVGLAAGGGWGLRLQVLFLACIVAPIVEEIMFRGVLYRHLRDATGRLGSFLSVVISGTLMSFVFAAIHPQGLLAVPVLMALAYAFTLAREWRGTLVPAMIAHGINNGVATLLLLVALAA